MEIYKTNKGWELVFEYSPRIITAIKAIKSNTGKKLAYFQAQTKTWILPSSTPTVEIDKLHRRFCPKIDIAGTPQKIEVVPPLPELTIEIPLKRPLFPFQALGVAYNLQHKRTLIGDDMGLGKTTQAVASCVGADRKCILVICPSAVKTSWKKEFEVVAGWKSIILTDSVKSTWMQFNKIAGVRVFIVNYESLQKYFVDSIDKDPKGNFKSSDVKFKECINLFDCIVFDESHKVKEKNTKQAKFCLGLSRNREYVFCLTGTPIQNKPIDLFTQLAILGYFDRANQSSPLEPTPELPFGNIKYFMNRYCGGYSGQGATNKQELGFKLKTTCYYRREKREVFTEMPKVIRNIISCEITTKSEYNKASQSLERYLSECEGKSPKEIAKSMRAEIMVTFQKCLHISALGKLDSVFEKIDEVIEYEEKYLLFAINQDVIQKIMQRYPKAVCYTGNENAEQRAKAIDKFQNDNSCQLIVISIDAGGTGLNGLQFDCSRGGFIQFPWHPAKANQAEARLDRIGQNEQCQFDYFVGENTKDERVMEIIESKRQMTYDIFGDEDTAEINVFDNLFRNK